MGPCRKTQGSHAWKRGKRHHRGRARSRLAGNRDRGQGDSPIGGATRLHARQPSQEWRQEDPGCQDPPTGPAAGRSPDWPATSPFGPAELRGGSTGPVGEACCQRRINSAGKQNRSRPTTRGWSFFFRAGDGGGGQLVKPRGRIFRTGARPNQCRRVQAPQPRPAGGGARPRHGPASGRHWCRRRYHGTAAPPARDDRRLRDAGRQGPSPTIEPGISRGAGEGAGPARKGRRFLSSLRHPTRSIAAEKAGEGKREQDRLTINGAWMKHRAARPATSGSGGARGERVSAGRLQKQGR